MSEFSIDSILAAVVAGGAAQYIVLGLIFTAVSLLVLGFAGLATAAPAARRLRRQPAGGDRHAPAVALEGSRWPLLKFLSPLEKHLEPQDLEARTKVRLLLMRAGYLAPSAMSNYYGLRLLLATALPIGFMLTLPLIARVIGPTTIIFIEAGLAVAGWMGPWVFVNLKAKERIHATRHSFPDALDLMLICVQAGLGLDQAVARVGEEMATAHPELAEQLRITSLELRAGRSREDALRNLGMRTGVDEIAAFVTLLIQSNELGTSISETLRVYSDDMRNIRLMKAEEKAAQLPVKLSIPLVLFMLPAFLGTLMLPVVINVIRVLLPATSGSGG